MHGHGAGCDCILDEGPPSFPSTPYHGGLGCWGWTVVQRQPSVENTMNTRSLTALFQGIVLAAGGVLAGLWFGHSLNAILDLFLGA